MITKEKCITDLQNFYTKENKIPKASNFRNQNVYVSYSTIAKLFGSWNNALLAANISIQNHRKKWTKEEIINSIILFTELHNKLPTHNDFNKSQTKYPCPKTVLKYFPTWNSALDSTGLSTIVGQTLSKEEAIKRINDFYTLYNRIPCVRDCSNNDYTLPSYGFLYKHFGSFNKAIIAAGLEPNLPGNFGFPTFAKDNRLYRSRGEAYFVDYFLFSKEEYKYELPYGNGWLYDFYLPKYDLYIEITAGLRPERLQEKLEFNKKLFRNFKVISHRDIYTNNIQEFK